MRYVHDWNSRDTSKLQFEKFPAPCTFRRWKTNFKTEVCSGSGHPEEAMLWIEEVEMAKSIDGLRISQSISGRVFPNFETLDARIVSALTKIIQNSSFKIHLEEQKAQKRWTNSSVADRSRMINEYFTRRAVVPLSKIQILAPRFAWRRRPRLRHELGRGKLVQNAST